MIEISTVILIKEDAFSDTHSIMEHYLDQLDKEGINRNTVQILPLLYNTPKKVLAKLGKAYLDKLILKIPASASRLIIADSSYFKFITKIVKITSKYGTTVPGLYTGYERFECVYVPNYRSLFKQPENADLIRIGLKAIAGNSNTALIESAEYAVEFGQDRELLDSLYEYPVLAVDIETTGLSLDSYIVSIAFAWDKHNYIAIDTYICGHYYTQMFLETYTGKLVFHNGLFDVKILIRQWWMDHSTDYKNMLVGLQYFKDIDDTMLMAYLAKNATTQVSLGLKAVALEYVGNYAIEITDISKYTRREVLEYNGIDVLATFYVYEKYASELTSKPYLEIFQPSIYPLLKMMLVGLPMDTDRVKEVNNILSAKEKVYSEQIQQNPHVLKFNEILKQDACDAANAKLKKLRKTVADFKNAVFNPNSNQQLSKLLFDNLGLPILEVTKSSTKEKVVAATGADVLKDLKNHTTDIDTMDLLDQVIGLADVAKINGTFVEPFVAAGDFIHGNLKLGGTQSGRISANNINTTNLPAHGPMGKLVKSCVKAPDDLNGSNWLFACADFSALEEKIGAILSNDPERIKVYTQGFDSHSLRAGKYFANQMPDIKEAIDKAETATKFWIDENGAYHCA